MQTFSSDSLLNSVQNLRVIASENEEEFDFSLSLLLLLVCIKVILCFFWKKYHILGVIHSLSLILSFQEIPT